MAANDTPDTTWHLLRAKRIEAGYTVTGLATAVGLSLPFVWQLEAGHRSASPPTLRQLADALNAELSPAMQFTVTELHQTMPKRRVRHRGPRNGAAA